MFLLPLRASPRPAPQCHRTDGCSVQNLTPLFPHLIYTLNFCEKTTSSRLLSRGIWPRLSSSPSESLPKKLITYTQCDYFISSMKKGQCHACSSLCLNTSLHVQHRAAIQELFVGSIKDCGLEKSDWVLSKNNCYLEATNLTHSEPASLPSVTADSSKGPSAWLLKLQNHPGAFLIIHPPYPASPFTCRLSSVPTPTCLIHTTSLSPGHCTSCLTFPSVPLSPAIST